MRENENHMPIELDETGVSVDAAVIAAGLGIEPAAVQARLREGAITSLWERGIDQDAGRYRLTFFHGGRRLRLILDEAGRILLRSVLDYGDRPLPGSLRRRPA